MIVKKKAKNMSCSAVKPCVFLVKQMNLRGLTLLLVGSLIGGNAVHLASRKPLPGAVCDGYFSNFGLFHVEYFKLSINIKSLSSSFVCLSFMLFEQKDHFASSLTFIL